MKNLTPLYGPLTDDERFRLFMAAAARGDKTEWERLSRTCPKETYRANSAGFYWRLRAARECTLMLAMPMYKLVGQRQVYAMLRELVPIAERPPPVEEWLTSREPDQDPSEAVFAGFGLPLAKSAWVGFVAFCAELNVDPKALLAANLPDLTDLIAKCGPGWETTDTSQVLVDAWKAEFRRAWDEWMSMS